MELVTDRYIPYAYNIYGAAELLASAVAVMTKTKGDMGVVNLVHCELCSQTGG